MAFVPDAGGRTSPFPTITIHAGNPQTEFFVGIIFSPSDRVEFPNAADRIRVRMSSAGLYPDFVLANRGRTSSFYIGMKIAGTRVGEQTAADAQYEAEGAQTARIVLGQEHVALLPHETIELNVQTRDERELRIYRAVRFASSRPEIVRVTANGTLVAIAPGEATITITSDRITTMLPVTVMEPAQSTPTVDPEPGESSNDEPAPPYGLHHRGGTTADSGR